MFTQLRERARRSLAALTAAVLFAGMTVAGAAMPAVAATSDSEPLVIEAIELDPGVGALETDDLPAEVEESTVTSSEAADLVVPAPAPAVPVTPVAEPSPAKAEESTPRQESQAVPVLEEANAPQVLADDATVIPGFPSIAVPTSTVGAVTWNVSTQVQNRIPTWQGTGGVVADKPQVTFPVVSVSSSAGTQTLQTSGATRMSFTNAGTVFYWVQFSNVKFIVGADGAGQMIADVESAAPTTSEYLKTTGVVVGTFGASGVEAGKTVTSTSPAFTEIADALLPSVAPHFVPKADNSDAAAKAMTAPVITLDAAPASSIPDFPIVTAPADTVGSVTWKVSDNFWDHLSSRQVTGGAAVAESALTFPVTKVTAVAGTQTLETAGIVRAGFAMPAAVTHYWVQLSNVKFVVTASGSGQVIADVESAAPGTNDYVKSVGVTVGTFTAHGVSAGKTVTASTPAFTGMADAVLASVSAHFKSTKVDGSDAERKAMQPPVLSLTQEGTPAPPVVPEKPKEEPQAPAAQAGNLIWGVKESFISYLGTPQAAGSVLLSQGATKNAANLFQFQQKVSNVNNGKGTVQFSGAIQFTGHHGVLDTSFKNFELELLGNGKANLWATVSALADGNPAGNISDKRLNVAEVTLRNSVTNKDGSVSFSSSRVVLTAAGAAAFSGFYEAGAIMDNLSFTLGSDVKVEDLEGGTTVKPTPKPVEKPSNPAGPGNGAVTAPEAAGKQPEVCVARTLTGATMNWNFKSSFVRYVGGLSDGKISASGVSQGNGFAWSGGSGKYNEAASKGLISFGGTVQFSGHAGVMDAKFSNMRVQFLGANSAALIADVVSNDMNGKAVTLNGTQIATISLGGKKATSGSTVTWSNAPVTLTSAGAKAFGGFYNAGEALDPITVSATLGGNTDCDTSTGTLAATGLSEQTTGVVGIAIAFLAAGAAVLVVGNRRKLAPVRK